MKLVTALFLLCATASVAHGQVTGFLVVSQDLVERDLVTLASTTIGTTGSITSGGLAMRSDGVLFSASYFTDELWQINPTTGSGTLVGSFGFDVTVDSGLTFDACGNLWLATRRGSLYQVDPETAATTLAAEFDDWIIALTAKGERLLALVRVGVPRQLAWIDPDNGTMELFGDPVVLPTLQVGLDFDENGGLWAYYWIDSPIPVAWVSSIVNYDPATGQVLGVAGDIGPPLAGNLAISPPQGICGSALPIPSSSPTSRVILIVLLALFGTALVARMR